jgi:hypothetical protein
MDEEEIASYVSAVVGGASQGAKIEPLGGRQGLIVCRVHITGKGSFIFKAVRESLRRELALTARLAQEVPGTIPHVLAYEEDEHRDLYWLVESDMGMRRLSDVPTVEWYCETAEALARVQQALLLESLDLDAMGVPKAETGFWEDVGLRALEKVAQSRGSLLHGLYDTLEAVIWSVDDLAMDASVLPLAIIHGDLHPGNVALLSDHPPRVCLLDWGSAYLGPAFLALEEMLFPAARYLKPGEGFLQVRSTYLRAWTPILGKPGRLERATLACQTLVRLLMLEESLRRSAPESSNDLFLCAAILQRLHESWQQWNRCEKYSR